MPDPTSPPSRPGRAKAAAVDLASSEITGVLSILVLAALFYALAASM